MFTTSWLVIRQLASISAARDSPYEAARSARLSPGWTIYSCQPAGDGHCVGCGGCVDVSMYCAVVVMRITGIGVRLGGNKVGWMVAVGGRVIIPSTTASERMLKTNNPDRTAAMIPIIPLRIIFIMV